MGVIFSKYRLFVLANMSWPWQLALMGMGPWLRVIAMVSLSTGDALNLAMWLCLGCFLVGVVMALEAKHAMSLATYPRGLPWPWLLAHWEGYFPKKEGFVLK